jgi:predicted NBD/HSP70 family sugar kinase
VLRPRAVRGANSAVLLQLLRQYGSLSRADIARQSGLSEGSVSRITSELIRRRIVCEDGEENSTGGRPGKKLRLDDGPIGLGVEILRGEARIASSTLSGRLLESVFIPIPADPNDALAAVAETISRFREQYKKNDVEGVGVSVRGIVNSHTGIVEFGNQTNWVSVSVQKFLHDSLKMPVYVDNNVRLAAIAEYNYGNLFEIRNSRCLLFAMVDEGVGIGIVLDGKLYYGPYDAAGEFGQMVIADKGDSEQLDRAGCFEKLASSTALCEYYASLAGIRSFLRSGDSRTRVRKICQLAISGNEAALGALSKACRYLGIGLANVIWGLNADAVVLDAPLNEAWFLVSQLIRDQFPKGENIVTFRHLTLRPSSLGGEATIIGAATLPFENLFTSGSPQRLERKSGKRAAGAKP